MTEKERAEMLKKIQEIPGLMEAEEKDAVNRVYFQLSKGDPDIEDMFREMLPPGKLHRLARGILYDISIRGEKIFQRTVSDKALELETDTSSEVFPTRVGDFLQLADINLWKELQSFRGKERRTAIEGGALEDRDMAAQNSIRFYVPFGGISEFLGHMHDNFIQPYEDVKNRILANYDQIKETARKQFMGEFESNYASLPSSTKNNLNKEELSNKWSLLFEKLFPSRTKIDNVVKVVLVPCQEKLPDITMRVFHKEWGDTQERIENMVRERSHLLSTIQAKEQSQQQLFAEESRLLELQRIKTEDDLERELRVASLVFEDSPEMRDLRETAALAVANILESQKEVMDAVEKGEPISKAASKRLAVLISSLDVSSVGTPNLMMALKELKQLGEDAGSKIQTTKAQVVKTSVEDIIDELEAHRAGHMDGRELASRIANGDIDVLVDLHKQWRQVKRDAKRLEAMMEVGKREAGRLKSAKSAGVKV